MSLTVLWKGPLLDCELTLFLSTEHENCVLFHLKSLDTETTGKIGFIADGEFTIKEFVDMLIPAIESEYLTNIISVRDAFLRDGNRLQ